jgi:putative tricarboxylic transport membrane protein
MSRINYVVWGLLLAFGAFIIHESLEHKYYGSDFGPGPGFFSFWLGVLLTVMSFVQIVMTWRRPVEPLPDGFIPGRDGVKRMLYIIGALVASLLLMKYLGFSLTMMVFCVFLLRTLGRRQSWGLTLTLSVIGSFGTWFLFGLLQVGLPTGFLGII